MEFAEGGDIGRQIEKFKKANKYIKEDTIWSYTIQICRALNDLHSRSILHRVSIFGGITDPANGQVADASTTPAIAGLETEECFSHW
jgi:hypothetical protein